MPVDPRLLIAELRDVLTPETYTRMANEFDKLADDIRDLEKDKYYHDHPEELHG